jgi:hypothetical protein
MKARRLPKGITVFGHTWGGRHGCNSVQTHENYGQLMAIRCQGGGGCAD